MFGRFRPKALALIASAIFAALSAADAGEPFTYAVGRRLLAQSGEPAASGEQPVLRGNLTELPINDPYKIRVNGTVFGQWTDLDHRGAYNRPDELSASVFGGGIGADRKIASRSMIGLRIGGTTIDVRPDNPGDSQYISNYYGLCRLGLEGDLWHWDFSVGAGGNQSDNQRTLGGVSGAAGSTSVSRSLSQIQWNYQTELGMHLKSGYTKIAPFLGFRSILLGQGDESDIPIDQRSLFPVESGQSYRAFLGSRFSWDYATYIAVLKPSIWGMWAHEFGDSGLLTTSDTSEFPVAWRCGGCELPRDRAILGVGIAAALRNMVDLWFHYDADFSASYQSHAITAGANIKY